MFGLPEIISERCRACGACVAACPTGALRLARGRGSVRLVRPARCTYCGRCEAVCSSGAIGCPYEIVLASRLRPPGKPALAPQPATERRPAGRALLEQALQQLRPQEHDLTAPHLDGALLFERP
jgi:ferredoxin